MTPKFVFVFWNDAWGNSVDDVHPDDVDASHKPKPMVSAGWLLRDNDVGMSIFSEKSVEDGFYRGRTFIPRAMIVEVRGTMKPGRTRTKKEKKTSEVAHSTDSSQSQ